MSPAVSLPGVQIFSRALACSTLIGFASATSSSIAWRVATSRRTRSSRPLD